MAYFSAIKTTRFSHHVHHAFHHIFTTKKPQKMTDFRKTLPKNL